MSILHSFRSFITDENLFQAKDTLILAVSGGIDSVVLCELCHQAKFNFTIAHCNFQLRGEESERDEQFVQSLGKKYSVPVISKKFETENFARESRTGIQEAARTLRYTWFNELVQSRHPQPATVLTQLSSCNPQPAIRTPPVFLVTAHHANDNIETLLMNFFRGTGIIGLRGILPRQGPIIRPLLFATKQELIGFVRENELAYVEDSSNLADKYTRNYFRNQVIPAIQKVFPKVEENLIDNLHRFREIETLYNDSVFTIKKKLLEPRGAEIHVPVLKLSKVKPLFTIVYEIIKDFNFTSHQTDEVISLLQSDTGKYVQSSSHKIIKNRNWLIIAPNNTLLAQNILILESDKIVSFDNGNLKIEKLSAINHQLSTANTQACLDGDEIKFPLLLRRWKRGDYFYPLGMDKKKKLSRFFIDQKMSLPDKDNTWVLEMNKKIVWVVGKRIDDRFKITEKTKTILKFSLC